MDGANEDGAGATIPTTLRTLLILEEIARLGVPVRAAELTAAIGLPKPTIHRLLATLEAEGFLARDIDGRAYAPGRRLRRLSANVLSSLGVRTARRAVLGRLAEEIGETCNIAVPDSEGMVYLDRVETKWPLRIQLPVGTRVPFHCTASGKMYLATLTEAQFGRYLGAARLARRTDATITDVAALRAEIAATRARGFAEDAEEFMDGMIAIAVPVLDGRERLLFTVSFHAPSMRLPLERARGQADRLREAAGELSRLVLL